MGIKKVLIIGSKGMLGGELVRLFNADKNYEVIGWDKEEINIKVLSKDKKINNASKLFDSGIHETLKITTDKGYSLTGHHEIMLPLLYSLLTGKF